MGQVNALAGNVRLHARRVSDEQLGRARLARLAPEERRAVDELAHSLAERIADSLLDQARRDRTLAAALESVYSSTSAIHERSSPTNRGSIVCGTGDSR